LLQPSVIFMGDAEKPFVKKVAKADKSDPKRLRKDLPKLVKSITGEDRVILVGTSSKPWDGDQKLLYQTYDKVIYIPRPDYSTVSFVWKDLLYKVSNVDRIELFLRIVGNYSIFSIQVLIGNLIHRL